jgi:hypothetical protein
LHVCMPTWDLTVLQASCCKQQQQQLLHFRMPTWDLSVPILSQPFSMMPLVWAFGTTLLRCMATFNYFTFFCFLFVLLSSSSLTDYRIRFVVVIFRIHDNYRSTLSTHHYLRVDPSTDFGLQGPVLQAATTTTTFARPHANLISLFSSLCSRCVVVHTFCKEACVINLCSGCFCFTVWQVWWHCRQIKDLGPINIRLFEGWNPYTCYPILPWPELSLAHVRFATH